MSFSFISKISLFLSSIFVFSCQNSFSSLGKKDNLDIVNNNIQFETNELFDFSSFENFENNSLDIHTRQSSSYSFLNKDKNIFKINNYESKYFNNIPINIIFFEESIFSINKEGDIVKFDTATGKLIDRIVIESDLENKEPVSFSLFENDFIIGFRSGEVARISKLGKVIWLFKNYDLLNTPIKIYDDNIIILYPEKIVFIEPSNGYIIFEKNFNSNNIIQSSGGKIKNLNNIIFFILPNSQFSALDIFLFEEHNLNFDEIALKTSINNLKDQIHIYKNFLVYVDDGNIVYTYDIFKDKFILDNYRIDNSNSLILFNNSLISKNENFIELYNIKNGNLFSRININKIINKRSKIIHAQIIDQYMHIFTDNGKIIILNQKLDIHDILNLKIKNINKIYNYQNKIFVSTEKGITYIY